MSARQISINPAPSNFGIQTVSNVIKTGESELPRREANAAQVQKFETHGNIQTTSVTERGALQQSTSRYTSPTSHRSQKNSEYRSIIDDKLVQNFLQSPRYKNKEFSKSRRTVKQTSERVDRNSCVFQSKILTDQELANTSEFAYQDDACYHSDTFKRNTFNRGPSEDIDPAHQRRVKFGQDLKGGRVYYAMPKSFYAEHGYKCDYEGYTDSTIQTYSPRYEGSKLEDAIKNGPASQMI